MVKTNHAKQFLSLKLMLNLALSQFCFENVVVWLASKIRHPYTVYRLDTRVIVFKNQKTCKLLGVN